MRRPSLSPRRARAGGSLIETMIALSIFPLLIGAALATLRTDEAEGDRMAARADMVRRADRALTTLTTELERSGFVTLGGIDYPFLIEGDALADAPILHVHEAANPAPDGVTAREVVFVLPNDVDGNGWPDLDAAMEAIDWNPVEVSYVLLPDGDGSNVLVRREDGGNDRVMARGVRRFVVDDALTSGFAFPLDVLRVGIELEDDGLGDQRQSLWFTRLVTLPNGGSDDE